MSWMPAVVPVASNGLARHPRRTPGVCLAVMLVVGSLGPSALGQTAVRIERSEGAVIEGELVGISGDGVVVSVDGAEQRLPLADVRLVERRETVPAPAPAGVRIDLVDGGWLEGDDLVCEGDSLTLARRDGSVTIPVARVRDAAWRRPDEAAADRPGAAWLQTVPTDAGSDLLVVAAADGQEFVECAVKGVSSDAVTVVLDEETIPVKRGKVLGIHWLRPAAAAARTGGVLVELAGGSLRVGSVAWSGGEVVLDGDLRLPAATVTRLDWAAGRSVSLAGVAPERTEVEPWFGGLAAVPGLAPFFAPRTVGAGEGFSRGGIVLRPRTVTVWRVPAEGRRFRATIATAAGAAAAGAALVAVAVDGREVARRRVDAPAFGEAGPDGIPLDIELSNARRLTVTVDFAAPGDIGCAVRLSSPVIDQ